MLQRWAGIWDPFGRGGADRGLGRPRLKPVQATRTEARWEYNAPSFQGQKGSLG